MSSSMKKAYAKEMKNMEAAGLLRKELIARQNDGMRATVGDNDLLNFFSTDILGWQTNQELKAAANQALGDHGIGNTSSRAYLGTAELHQQLETKICEFLKLESCIVYPSGYMANLGLFDPMTNEKDVIFVDELCNPGIIDGARISRAKVLPYGFKNMDKLEYHLKCSQNSRFRIVATDAIFQTDGDWPDLVRMQELKNTYDAITVYDDTLGLGILGENGRGTLSHLKVTAPPDIMTGSFAWGFGNIPGAFVGGDKTLIEWLRQTSRPYLMSEALSPVNAAVAIKAIEILESGQTNIQQLYSNAEYLKKELLFKNWEVVNNGHPFISIRLGSTLKVQKIVQHLFQQNILISGLCFPNVPENSAQLRVYLTVDHTSDQINQLIKVLDEAMSLFGQD